MGAKIDMTGKRYNKLVCLEEVGRQKHHVLWKFQCDCGTVIIARGGDVRQNKTMSCGCYRDQKLISMSVGVKPKERKKK